MYEVANFITAIQVNLFILNNHLSWSKQRWLFFVLLVYKIVQVIFYYYNELI